MRGKEKWTAETDTVSAVSFGEDFTAPAVDRTPLTGYNTIIINELTG